MKTINYITYDAWWDTDKTIIPQLTGEYRMNITVLSPLKDRKYNQKEGYGANSVVEVTQKYRERDPRCLIPAIKMFYHIVRRGNRNDLFWLMPGYNFFLLFLLLLYLPKDRTIISYHDYTPHFYTRKLNLKNLNEWISSKIKGKTCSKYNKFFFYSNIQCCNFQRDYPYKKTVVCNMPLKSLGRYRRKDHETKTFLFFGAIQEYKRVDLFIDAGLSLKEENAKFIIAGKPNYDCSDIIEKVKDVPNFFCDLEFIGEEDALNYFNETDFLVLPYIDSTQSGPMLIALNYGIPVIASDIVAFRDFIVNEQNGYLFESGNSDSLKKMMLNGITLNNKEYQNMRDAQEKRKKTYEQSTNAIKALQVLTD